MNPTSGACRAGKGAFENTAEPLSHRSVLYIEDDQDNILLVTLLLESRPQIVLRVATNARDGVAAAIDEPPDLILLDNRLPDATARDVLGQLALDKTTAAIPTIVLSADSGSVIADELIEMGATEFLMKPFDIHHLLFILDRHLP
jgi:CheY-like chemotaxis protein